jgi:hypothetical protein
MMVDDIEGTVNKGIITFRNISNGASKTASTSVGFNVNRKLLLSGTKATTGVTLNKCYITKPRG